MAGPVLISSSTYTAWRLIEPVSSKANGEPPRDRSNDNRPGTNPSFATSPCPPHWAGSVRLLLSEGLPPASTHGELKVGSVRPREKRSLSRVESTSDAGFEIVHSVQRLDVDLRAGVGEAAVLTNGRRRVGEGVGARCVLNPILTHEARWR